MHKSAVIHSVIIINKFFYLKVSLILLVHCSTAIDAYLCCNFILNFCIVLWMLFLNNNNFVMLNVNFDYEIFLKASVKLTWPIMVTFVP